MKQLYRETFGLPLPPPGTRLSLRSCPGMQYYLLWEDCPDDENIVAGWGSREQMVRIAEHHGWQLTTRGRGAGRGVDG